MPENKEYKAVSPWVILLILAVFAVAVFCAWIMGNWLHQLPPIVEQEKFEATITVDVPSEYREAGYATINIGMNGLLGIDWLKEIELVPINGTAISFTIQYQKASFSLKYYVQISYYKKMGDAFIQVGET